MVLTPKVALLGLTCDGSTVLGVRDFSLPETTEMKEITADNNTAKARLPTIDDASADITIIEDKDDAGQDKIRASKAAHTLLTYVFTRGRAVSTLSAYVQEISRKGTPADEVEMTVKLAVSGGCSTVVS